jgi:hypothetical protein
MHSFLLNYVQVSERLNTSIALSLRKEPPEPIGVGRSYSSDGL